MVDEVGRWRAGDEGEIDGFRYRVRQGKKSPDDLVLELYGPGGWRPVRMKFVALLTDFLFENEDVLYSRDRGALGGCKFMEYLLVAAAQGWEAAEVDLQGEKMRRRQRDARAS